MDDIEEGQSEREREGDGGKKRTLVSGLVQAERCRHLASKNSQHLVFSLGEQAFSPKRNHRVKILPHY